MHYHLVGIGGVGMSALAEALADASHRVTGSDRFLDQATAVSALEALRERGIELFPQDGSGVSQRPDFVVVSTAVEDTNPDLRQARELGIPVVHRAKALADLYSHARVVAVAGTSGKSTTTAILGHLLAEAGLGPAVVNGAPLIGWMKPGRVGSVLAPTVSGEETAPGVEAGVPPYAVLEVDESDRSLLVFSPYAALLLNASADHFPLEETNALFDRFLEKCARFCVDGRGEAPIPFTEGDWSVSFEFEGEKMRLPMPGGHNAQNAFMACRMARLLGVKHETLAPALASFRGIWRRLQWVGTRADGVRVIDDYAHNTAKIASALRAVQARSARTVAIWRPHGYTPLRSMWNDLCEMFAEVLRPEDLLLVLPVFDAGGTVRRDVSSEAFAAALRQRKVPARWVASHDEALEQASAFAKSGDCILTLGARDPALPSLAARLAAYCP